MVPIPSELEWLKIENQASLLLDDYFLCDLVLVDFDAYEIDSSRQVGLNDARMVDTLGLKNHCTMKVADPDGDWSMCVVRDFDDDLLAGRIGI